MPLAGTCRQLISSRWLKAANLQQQVLKQASTGCEWCNTEPRVKAPGLYLNIRDLAAKTSITCYHQLRKHRTKHLTHSRLQGRHCTTTIILHALCWATAVAHWPQKKADVKRWGQPSSSDICLGPAAGGKGSVPTAWPLLPWVWAAPPPWEAAAHHATGSWAQAADILAEQQKGDPVLEKKHFSGRYCILSGYMQAGRYKNAFWHSQCRGFSSFFFTSH